MPQPQWVPAPPPPQAPAPVGWSQNVAANGDVADSAQTQTIPAVPVAIYRNAGGVLERQFIAVNVAASLGITLDPATIVNGSGLIKISV